MSSAGLDPEDAGELESANPLDSKTLLHSLPALRELAERAARAGGVVARERFRGDNAVRRKPDGSDVTDADEAAQAAVLACLREARPDDGVIAEETVGCVPDAPSVNGVPDAPVRTNDRLCWIIDPLDGTRNYISGVPIYACTIAAMLGGYPIVGVTYDPEREEMYSASRAEGFLIDGRPVGAVAAGASPAAVASAPRGRRSPPAAPPEFRRKPLAGIPSSLQGSAYELLQGWRRRVVVRNLGSTALHLALVAAGHLQASLTSDTKLWDIAAGWLMVTVAGGVMTRIDGSPIFPLDVATYSDQAIATLAVTDAQTHARLVHPGEPAK
jgi:myo-inositol-1(or 4)-monophosphatase